MSFADPAFYAGFALLFVLFRALPWRAGRWLLLVASYAFYGSANPWYCLLLFASTFVDYVVALRLSASSDPRWRCTLLAVSVGVNLCILGFFKYGDFLTSNLDVVLAWAGCAPLPLLDLVLPVGISFYTFQTLSYTIDVYRRRIEPTRSLSSFALYVAFFPQLVAGPIERAARLQPQLMRKSEARERDLELGLQRVLWGLVKKTVFADRLGLMVDQAYAAPAGASAPVLLLAVVAFLCQLYLDFSGYCDIAIGLARMLGVQLSENFAWPLLARNPSDFWARWHMTLTRWFRDYVFTPLGGLSRRRPVRSVANTFAVMTLIGIWHGASWNFVLFGLVQGALVGGYQAMRLFLPRGRQGPLLGHRPWSAPLGTLLLFPIMAATTILFRAPTLEVARQVVEGIWTHAWVWDERYDVHLGIVCLVLGLQVVRATFMHRRVEVPLPAFPRAAFLASLILLVLYGAVDTRARFIYFQF